MPALHILNYTLSSENDRLSIIIKYMSEHEEQEAIFKVTDRRSFNPDGSVREGVVIEKSPEKPAPPAPTVEEPAPEALPEEAEEAEAVQEISAERTLGNEEELSEEDEIPGEQDPASFVNFMMSLASQAATALGAMPHPMTGQRAIDLDLAKHWIDTLAMLKDKTKGNLHPKENALLTGLLSDLRLQYVTLAQVAEEKLKQQAAQKFSSKDVLGK
jgi:hypothetical protein